MKRLFFTLLAVVVAIAVSAQSVGSIYRIVSYTTGKAITNNGNPAADAPVVMGEYDQADDNQQWAIISDGAGENCGLMNVASRQCIDMALSAQKAGCLLQWKPNMNNQNQVFKIHSPGIAGSAVQLLCAADPTLAVTEYANGELWMQN